MNLLLNSNLNQFYSQRSKGEPSQEGKPYLARGCPFTSNVEMAERYLPLPSGINEEELWS